MTPAADAAPVPHAHADVADALAEVKAMLVAAVAPKPLLIDQADVPTFLGVSRSCWFRWRSEGFAPKPVKAEGAGVKFRRSDLERFVERMKTA